MKKIKHGKTLVPKGAFPERHELETAWFFNALGKNVEFLVPVDKQHIKTPDIKMDGIYWEIKAPKNNGKHTIEHLFRKALKQSCNVIFDLRRSKMHPNKCILQLKKQFRLSQKAKILLIITDDYEFLDLKK
ncbi:MAG: hypothetical protein FWG51_03015 [Firmicutes bacterium]|nr:hypothetical protein [Bacillota bacterium]